MLCMGAQCHSVGPWAGSSVYLRAFLAAFRTCILCYLAGSTPRSSGRWRLFRSIGHGSDPCKYPDCRDVSLAVDGGVFWRFQPSSLIEVLVLSAG